MRAVFVLTTVVLALLLGIVAAASESRLLIGALIVGFAPVVWAVSHGIELLTGRDMWNFGAPYPYRWMRDRGDIADVAQNSGHKPVEVRQETDARSSVPLAA